MPFRPLGTEEVVPLEETQSPWTPPTQKRTGFRTFSEQRGALTMPKETAIERPDVPEWLQVIEQNVLAPAGGVAAAAPLVPIAGVTGVGAAALPFTQPAAFTAGTMATEAMLRQLNKAMGYRVPRAPTTGERAVEAGATTLAYPFAELPAALKAGAENVLGLTAREQARTKAAQAMTGKLAKLPDLHTKVGNIVEAATERIPSAMTKAEKDALKAGTQRAQTAATRMVAGVPPLASEAELAASGRNLSAAASLRARTVGQLGELYNRKQAALGAEYEALYAPYMKELVPDDTLKAFSAKASGIKENAKEYESLPGALRSIVDEAAGWGEDKTQAITEEVTQQMLGNNRVPASVLLQNPALKAQVDAEVARRLAEEKPQVTFGRLKQIRGDVRRYFDGKNAPARHASQSMDRAVLEAYGDADIPKNPDLNARYRIWRDRWTWQNVRALRHAEDPAALKGLVNARMLEPLMDVADQPQQGVVRQLIAQTIRDENLSPSDIVRRFPAPVLRSHFGPGADDVANWARVQERGNQLVDMLNTDPALKQQLQRQQSVAANRIFTKASAGVKKSVIGFLDSLGPQGAPLSTAVREMTPEQATAFYLQTMRSPQFGQQLIEAARRDAPLPTPKSLPGIGSLSFALGLGTVELARRGEITSPYVASAPFALALEAFTGKGRDLIVRLIESDGMAATVRLLDRVANPATRKPAMSLLARRTAQIAASDVFRGIAAPYDEGEQ